jgi:hypothetical protein
MGHVKVTGPVGFGRLPRGVVQRVVRQSLGRFLACYENGLARNPYLEGHVDVALVVNRDGTASNVSTAGSKLPDGQVVSCVARTSNDLTFPRPEAGTVKVNYTLILSPS